MTKGPEAQTQRAIIDLLVAERVWHRRTNTGAVLAEHGGRKRMVRFGVSGDADIYCLLKKTLKSGKDVAIVAYIEVKSQHGKQTESQRQFERDVKEQGAQYLVARSVEDVAVALNEWRSAAFC